MSFRQRRQTTTLFLESNQRVCMAFFDIMARVPTISQKFTFFIEQLNIARNKSIR